MLPVYGPAPPLPVAVIVSVVVEVTVAIPPVPLPTVVVDVMVLVAVEPELELWARYPPAPPMTKPATAAPTAAPVPTAFLLEIFESNKPFLFSPVVIFLEAFLESVLKVGFVVIVRSSVERQAQAVSF
jgi:hypothetical protein